MPLVSSHLKKLVLDHMFCMRTNQTQLFMEILSLPPCLEQERLNAEEAADYHHV
jgi:hypothetical protein